MRPFLDVTTGAQNALIAGFPGIATGSVNANETSRFLGAGALYRQDIGMWSGQRISALIGYRYLRSSDTLWITDTINSIAFGTFTRPTISRRRATSTALILVSPATGAVAHGRCMARQGRAWRQLQQCGCFGLDDFDDSRCHHDHAGRLPRAASNSGHFSQTRFAVIPELSLKAGYQIAPPGA